jgi:hypothetical protein
MDTYKFRYLAKKKHITWGIDNIAAKSANLARMPINTGH